MLGKRKRQTAVISRKDRDHPAISNQIYDAEAANKDVFRQYFEAKFEPLSNLALPIDPSKGGGVEESSDHESEISEWEGISNENEVDTVQIIDHENAGEVGQVMEANSHTVTSFMSSKPPRAIERSTSKSTGSVSGKDGVQEATNLKNDLDLQRLLQESSLFKKSHGTATVDVSRHRMTDLRLQSLGVKSSLFGQEKMPMAHRQGMRVKAVAREDHRRKSARENGIILEKVSSTDNVGKAKMRDRGVGAPGVGQFRGGTLRLSRKDLSEIQGTQRGQRNKTRGKRP